MWLCEKHRTVTLGESLQHVENGHCAKCDIDKITALKARVEELESAIRRHRENVWGEAPVKHDEDIELYAVLDKGA